MRHVRPFFLFALALVLMLAVGRVFAASVPLTYKGLGVVKRSDGWHYQGTVPAQTGDYTLLSTAGVPKINANASANWFVGMGALVQNGGVVFNAAVPIAATAAAAAVTAVRANPAGLITSAVASYLLSKGIEYANGELTKTETLQGTETATYYCYGPGGATYCHRTLQAACSGFETQWPAGYGPFIARPENTSYPGRYCEFMGPSRPFAGYGQAMNIMQSCYTPEGSPVVYPNNGTCTAQSVGRPLVESDWDAARVGYWPDDAIRDLVRNGVPLPTDKPTFTPESKDVPVSDPYVDPTNGKRYRDVARVTPSPSAPDSADVQTVKQEVDQAGNPVEVGGQPVAPEKETDWCKLHPEAAGCQPLDDVPDVDIPQTTNNFSVNPVSGFGADNAACPAGQHLFTRGGQSVDWSWSQVCTFANGIRPLVIAFAWIAAIAMVLVVGRRN